MERITAIVKSNLKSIILKSSLMWGELWQLLDLKVIQQINFTENLDRAENTIFFIIEEAKETILDFPLGTTKEL